MLNLGRACFTWSPLISISGEADVDIPLAYGIYYYKEGNTWHKLIVGRDVPDVTGDGVSSENTQRVDNHTENLKADNISVTSGTRSEETYISYLAQMRARADNSTGLENADSMYMAAKSFLAIF